MRYNTRELALIYRTLGIIQHLYYELIHVMGLCLYQNIGCDIYPRFDFSSFFSFFFDAIDIPFLRAMIGEALKNSIRVTCKWRKSLFQFVIVCNLLYGSRLWNSNPMVHQMEAGNIISCPYCTLVVHYMGSICGLIWKPPRYYHMSRYPLF